MLTLLELAHRQSWILGRQHLPVSYFISHLEDIDWGEAVYNESLPFEFFLTYMPLNYWKRYTFTTTDQVREVSKLINLPNHVKVTKHLHLNEQEIQELIRKKKWLKLLDNNRLSKEFFAPYLSEFNSNELEIYNEKHGQTGVWNTDSHIFSVEAPCELLDENVKDLRWWAVAERNDLEAWFVDKHRKSLFAFEYHYLPVSFETKLWLKEKHPVCYYLYYISLLERFKAKTKMTVGRNKIIYLYPEKVSFKRDVILERNFVCRMKKVIARL